MTMNKTTIMMETGNVLHVPCVSSEKDAELKKHLKRGQIWHINDEDTTTTGCETWSNRPAIIVSNDVTNDKAGFVSVVYLTTQKSKRRRLPTHVNVMSGDKIATAMCEQVPPVDKSRIGFYIGSITEDEMRDIDKAILFGFGISNTLNPSTVFKKWAKAVNRYDINLDVENRTVPDINDLAYNTDIDNKDSDGTLSTINVMQFYQAYKNLYEHEHAERIEAESALEQLKNSIAEIERTIAQTNK